MSARTGKKKTCDKIKCLKFPKWFPESASLLISLSPLTVNKLYTRDCLVGAVVLENLPKAARLKLFAADAVGKNLI